MQQIAAADAGDRGADLPAALGVVEKAHERGDAGDPNAAVGGGSDRGDEKARGGEETVLLNTREHQARLALAILASTLSNLPQPQ